MKGFVIMMMLLPALYANAQSSLDTKVAAAAKQLKCATPDEEKPVTLNAQLIKEGDSIAVIVKVQMAPGWHIYQYVPSSQPYIQIEHILKVPENLRAVGEWEKTKATSSASDPGVLIYEEEAVFIHKALKLSDGKADDVVKAGLYYQTCNLRQCLPPAEEIFDLKY